MSPTELAALAAELEPDIRAADNDMREIDDLQQKGISGAGTLSSMFRGCLFHASAHRDSTTVHRLRSTPTTARSTFGTAPRRC
jgi:hypothetical protein